MSVAALAELLFRRRAAVLTGAGCSTESGIPDYRGPQTRHRRRSPILLRDFLEKPEARRRYWARSSLGWPLFRDAVPNAAHRALAALQQAGVVDSLITQNVDRLHQKAGSRAVRELHGALHETRCLGCGDRRSRDELQGRIHAQNPGFGADQIAAAPDGDADVDDRALASFEVPACTLCGGLLKPDVVLFGEAVPRPKVEDAFAAVDVADLLLVIGSSLTVFSGYRFALRAAERGIPIAVLNLGETRADPLATLRVEARAGPALQQIAALLS